MEIEDKQRKPFKALSLDGGGMRGLYTAAVLNSLSERFGNGSELDIGQGFNLITGTSTGAILATGISAGVPVKEIIKLYRDQGPTIFSNPIPQEKLKKGIWGLGNLNSPANGNENLSSALTDIFKTETVGEIFICPDINGSSCSPCTPGSCIKSSLISSGIPDKYDTDAFFFPISLSHCSMNFPELKSFSN